MRQSPSRLALPYLILGLLPLLATSPASANYYELLRRVPESANTIILIDVERMLMSPIAMKEKWRDKGNSQGVTLHFPVNAVRYMLSSKIDFTSNFETSGDIALIETAEGVSLPFLARSEGGYLDTMNGQEVAFSPRNAFFVSFKPNILGVSFPANRQELGRWMRSVQRLDKPQVSEYLQEAVKLAHGQELMVVAMDLTDAFTSRMVRDRLHRAESLAGKNVDLDILTRVLTSAKGVTMTMTADDRLNGKIRLDLGESPAPIKEVARALMIEVLERNDILLDEMREWRLLIEAKAVSLEGRLTSQGLRRLTDLIPFPTDTVELKQAGTQARTKEGENSPNPSNSNSAGDVKVAASKKYFQRISQRLDDLRTEVKGSQKPKFAQKMLNDAALELDRLPVLNVDEELLAYGAGISSSLRNMRNLSKNASLDYMYRKAEIQGNSGYGYGGFYGGGSVAGATTSTHRQETAVLQSNELAVLTMLEEKTAEIRKKMTLKYQVEF